MLSLLLPLPLSLFLRPLHIGMPQIRFPDVYVSDILTRYARPPRKHLRLRRRYATILCEVIL